MVTIAISIPTIIVGIDIAMATILNGKILNKNLYKMYSCSLAKIASHMLLSMVTLQTVRYFG